MAVQLGSTLPRWADLSPYDRAERLFPEQKHTRAAYSKPAGCCLCGEQVKPNRKNLEPAPASSKYKQSCGSAWLAHVHCIDDTLKNKPKINAPKVEASAGPKGEAEFKSEKEELAYLRGWRAAALAFRTPSGNIETY